ncbi:MAG: Hsp20/alpha crystallin family protein [Flavobacteriales bacterium]|nr:Hsp20/alpha crystallin family protein [Flavobacteriales bacterium]
MSYTKDLTFPTTFRPFTDVLDRFLGDMDPFHGGATMKRLLPRVNIVEDERAYRLEVQAPGYAKEDLKLNLEQDVLTISAEKEQNETTGNERYTRREFSSQAFSRSFRLPELIDADAISADHLNGVLTVRIPKKAEVKPAAKQINIG